MMDNVGGTDLAENIKIPDSEVNLKPFLRNTKHPQRSMRTADSTFSPRKRRPTLMKRSGASVTKKLCAPLPSFLTIDVFFSTDATTLAVSSAESTRRTPGPMNLRMAFFNNG